jgi:hypothetical protein
MVGETHTNEFSEVGLNGSRLNPDSIKAFLFSGICGNL